MYAKVKSLGVFGLDAFGVTVECDISSCPLTVKYEVLTVFCLC